MTDSDRLTDGWLAHAVSGALRAAARLNLAGLVLALANLLLAGIMSPAGWQWLLVGGMAALVGAAQLWLMVRVEIDRTLFGALATAASADDLRALDAALVALAWVPPARAGRALSERARGAARFVHLAAGAAALQWLMAVVILLLR